MPTMKQTFRTLLFGALALSSSAVYAQSDSDDIFFKNYTGVVKLLRASGIEPSRVEWNDIEMMCTQLKDPSSEIPYNRCRFERARDQAIYRDDSSVCDNESRAINPDNVRYQGFINSAPINGGVTTSVPVINSAPAVEDKVAFKRYIFDRCMTDKGWRSPRNYRFGLTSY